MMRTKIINDTARNANPFASTFAFLPSLQSTQKKAKELASQCTGQGRQQWKLDTTTQRTDRRAAGNSGFKKLAVQWLQEVQFSNQTFVVADSFVLRNRQLLKPTKRCVLLKLSYPTTKNKSYEKSKPISDFANYINDLLL